MNSNSKQSWIRWVFQGGIALSVLSAAGCNVVGFLATPGPFEQKRPADYDMQKAQDRRIMVWVECPRSSGVDADLAENLETGLRVYMTRKMKIDPAHIVERPADRSGTLAMDVLKIGRQSGAGFVLLVQVDDYDMTPLRVRDLYSGQMVARASLFDTDTGAAVWPSQPEGKMVNNAVEMESGGRTAVQSRLIAGTVHCILRHLYPCEKTQFKHSTERISTQQVFEIETY